MLCIVRSCIYTMRIDVCLGLNLNLGSCLPKLNHGTSIVGLMFWSSHEIWHDAQNKSMHRS